MPFNVVVYGCSYYKSPIFTDIIAGVAMNKLQSAIQYHGDALISSAWCFCWCFLWHSAAKLLFDKHLKAASNNYFIHARYAFVSLLLLHIELIAASALVCALYHRPPQLLLLFQQLLDIKANTSFILGESKTFTNNQNNASCFTIVEREKERKTHQSI